MRSRNPEKFVGDGFVTDLRGVALAVLTADCFPVLLVDTKKKAVGAFHAGWRGTVKRIVEKGVGIMRLEFGSRPEDIHAAIGPGIQKCSFEVGEVTRVSNASGPHGRHARLPVGQRSRTARGRSNRLRLFHSSHRRHACGAHDRHVRLRRTSGHDRDGGIYGPHRRTARRPHARYDGAWRHDHSRLLHRSDPRNRIPRRDPLQWPVQVGR